MGLMVIHHLTLLVFVFVCIVLSFVLAIGWSSDRLRFCEGDIPFSQTIAIDHKEQWSWTALALEFELPCHVGELDLSSETDTFRQCMDQHGVVADCVGDRQHPDTGKVFGWIILQLVAVVVGVFLQGLSLHLVLPGNLRLRPARLPGMGETAFLIGLVFLFIMLLVNEASEGALVKSLETRNPVSILVVLCSLAIYTVLPGNGPVEKFWGLYISVFTWFASNQVLAPFTNIVLDRQNEYKNLFTHEYHFDHWRYGMLVCIGAGACLACLARLLAREGEGTVFEWVLVLPVVGGPLTIIYFAASAAYHNLSLIFFFDLSLTFKVRFDYDIEALSGMANSMLGICTIIQNISRLVSSSRNWFCCCRKNNQVAPWN